MAATVLSGTGSVTYTNSTGQNVRVVINYMASPTAMSWSATAGGTVSLSAGSVTAIGRNLAFNSGAPGTNGSQVANNMILTNGSETGEVALPTELMLATGQTFSATCTSHNIVIIPEAG